MQMKKYYDLFNLIYFNMKTIKQLFNKLFSAKPEQSPRTSKKKGMLIVDNKFVLDN